MTKSETNKRRMTAVFAGVVLILALVIIGYTYSRYSSSGTANSTATIAKWSVKIGDKDLDEYTTDAPLTAPLTLNPNENVSSGVIAPGSTGTYTVEIDPTGSQVAIDYVIKTSGITGTTNENIKVTGAKYWVGTVSGEGTDAAVTGTDGVTINESLTDVLANKKLTVKVTVEWENDEDNNETDTVDGQAAGTINVSTSITAKQHI